MQPTNGFTLAGTVANRGLNILPAALPTGRLRHRFGEGPFARLVMPPLPNKPGFYLWQMDDEIVYVGQTRTPLRKRLGPMGYSTISAYNTFAPEPGRRNGGQQTNCRVNALTNAALAGGRTLRIWYRVTAAVEARAEEALWMRNFGLPAWNRRIEESTPRRA